MKRYRSADAWAKRPRARLALVLPSGVTVGLRMPQVEIVGRCDRWIRSLFAHPFKFVGIHFFFQRDAARRHIIYHLNMINFYIINTVPANGEWINIDANNNNKQKDAEAETLDNTFLGVFFFFFFLLYFNCVLARRRAECCLSQLPRRAVLHSRLLSTPLCLHQGSFWKRF